ncbi:MAG TPA: hypothetical protein VD864_10620, partial [Nocardioides sp.]|nr:hypothetical protein [Nocardioides sp.]
GAEKVLEHADDLERETQRRYWLAELRPLLGDLEDTPEDTLEDTPDSEPDLTDTAAADGEDEPWRLTDGQVVGMLEHLLGAEQVDGSPDRD